MAQRIWQGAKCVITWEKLLYWSVSKVFHLLRLKWILELPITQELGQQPATFSTLLLPLCNSPISPIAATISFNSDLLLCLEASLSHCSFLHCFSKHHKAISSIPKESTKRLVHQSLGGCHLPAQLLFKNWNHLIAFQSVVLTKCTHTDTICLKVYFFCSGNSDVHLNNDKGG